MRVCVCVCVCDIVHYSACESRKIGSCCQVIHVNCNKLNHPGEKYHAPDSDIRTLLNTHNLPTVGSLYAPEREPRNINIWQISGYMCVE